MKKLLLALITASNIVWAEGYLTHGVKYLYVDDADNKIVCSVQSLCDIALLKNDTLVNWIMTKGGVWLDSARKKTSYVDNNGRTHVVLQATDVDGDNPVILVGTDTQYHFNLIATQGKTTNQYVFIERDVKEYNSQNSIIDDGVGIDFTNKKFSYDRYVLYGDVDSVIRPLAVFNDGKKTYIQMSKYINQTDLPTIYTVDRDGSLQTVAGVRYRKPYFIVDGVKPRYAVIVGSSTSDSKLRVDIKRKSGWSLFE